MCPFNPAIFFLFFKAWDLVLLPTGDVASQRLFKFSQRASREGKNARGKVGKEQIKTRKISQPPVETGTGARAVHLNRLTHASERGCRVENQDWITFESELEGRNSGFKSGKKNY